MSSQPVKFSESIDFSHRADGSGFYDSINPVLGRIAALADLIEVVFYADTDALDMGTLQNAAQAIRLEAKDAMAMVFAWQIRQYDLRQEANCDAGGEHE